MKLSRNFERAGEESAGHCSFPAMQLNERQETHDSASELNGEDQEVDTWQPVRRVRVERGLILNEKRK